MPSPKPDSGKITLVTPPAVLPLTLDDAKDHLRVTHTDDDAAIAALVETAAAQCEDFTGLSLINRQYRLSFDRWPATTADKWWDGVREGVSGHKPHRAITLPRPPLATVQSIQTRRTTGDPLIYSADHYIVDAGLPGRIVLKTDVTAPESTQEIHGIDILFTAGYGTTADKVPPALRHGIRMLVAYMYENRGDNTGIDILQSSGAAAVFAPFRQMRFS